MLADGLQLEKVYVDETDFNLWIKRTYGKARVGERVNRRVGGQRGRNVTVIAAISDRVGVLYHEIHCTSVTNDCFNGFVRTLEQFLIGRNAVIILDNASVHNQMADIYPELTFKYLPPDSPFLNPNELFFSVQGVPETLPAWTSRSVYHGSSQAAGTTVCALRETTLRAGVTVALPRVTWKMVQDNYQRPDTQMLLSSTYLSAVHVTAVKTTLLRVYTQSSD